MMTSRSVLLARQPILDVVGRVAGYELLYQGPPIMERGSAAVASARVLCEALATVGLERLVGENRLFVRVDAALLESGVTAILPRGRSVIELDSGIELSPTVLQRLDRLRADGIAIAMERTDASDAHAAALARCDYVAVDISRDSGWAEWSADARGGRPVRLLARQVDTHEQFARAEQAGFDFFQGFYFASPEPVATKRVAPNAIAILDLLVALNGADAEPATLGALIGRDPALAHQLLRLAHSSYYGRRRLVSTLTDVVVQLGHDVVRQWAALLLMARLGEAKPRELLTLALVRARMCEALAERMTDPRRESAFMVGLLSVLDALLDRPMQRVAAELPLSEDLRLALVGDSASTLSPIVRAVLAYERGQWSQATGLSTVDSAALRDCYVNALDFARHMQPGNASASISGPEDGKPVPI
ncbi:MAG: HDOD domain-containing protein [Proteobacteria bacterium]|nr:HDOD domain-containing protein [Pseudomonadota bacterium]